MSKHLTFKAMLLLTCLSAIWLSCKKDRESVVTERVKAWETLIDGNSFASYGNFEAKWNYNYPWGTDHNGSARMAGSSTNHSQIALSSGEMTITATRLASSPGNSTANGFTNVAIWYNSGACHAKQQVLINDQFPSYTISGDFAVPTARGTWPAFWITGVNSWPPESDIMEFKGNSTNWQNTYDGAWENKLTNVSNAGSYHNYKCWYNKISATDVECHYYIDNNWVARHVLSNAVNKPMWLIINMQMEGDSGSPGPTGNTLYRIKNVYMGRERAF
ncbi:glycoside hydrolase [Pedobacter sp. MR22-3]|uniref:glycoside hydrolase n=1 Tax=Pedobacter sp. MR22-3 TaxID=2994552 RepID=UPI0022481A50|nr:glycoside hydrolase [Pedobacter sp. MR22-3]MCX2582465.1 glycoside hydrolase [Pedobacter sp. MR22-3]